MTAALSVSLASSTRLRSRARLGRWTVARLRRWRPTGRQLHVGSTHSAFEGGAFAHVQSADCAPAPAAQRRAGRPRSVGAGRLGQHIGSGKAGLHGPLVIHIDIAVEIGAGTVKRAGPRWHAAEAGLQHTEIGQVHVVVRIDVIGDRQQLISEGDGGGDCSRRTVAVLDFDLERRVERQSLTVTPQALYSLAPWPSAFPITPGDTSVYYNNSWVRIGSPAPLRRLHVRDAGVVLAEEHLSSEMVVIEDNDATLGLYSHAVRVILEGRMS